MILLGKIIYTGKNKIKKYSGIGKPEPLKGNLQGYWSRRIDDVNRLVYRIVDNRIEILQCRSHYNIR